MTTMSWVLIGICVGLGLLVILLVRVLYSIYRTLTHWR